MKGLIDRAEQRALAKVRQVRDSLAESAAIWLPGVRILVEASSLRLIGRNVRARWMSRRGGKGPGS